MPEEKGSPDEDISMGWASHLRLWNVAMYREPHTCEDGHDAALHEALERATVLNVPALAVGACHVEGIG